MQVFIYDVLVVAAVVVVILGLSAHKLIVNADGKVAVCHYGKILIPRNPSHLIPRYEYIVGWGGLGRVAIIYLVPSPVVEYTYRPLPLSVVVS